MKVKACCSADPKKQCQRSAEHREWKGDIGCSISKRADCISDKKLVSDIVNGADKHCDNAWNSKTCHQRGNSIGTKWICHLFFLCHVDKLLFYKIQVSKCLYFHL